MLLMARIAPSSTGTGCLRSWLEEDFRQPRHLHEQGAMGWVLGWHEHGAIDHVLVHQTDPVAGIHMEGEAAARDSLGLLADILLDFPPVLIPMRPSQSRRLRPNSTSREPVRSASDCRYSMIEPVRGCHMARPLILACRLHRVGGQARPRG